MHTLVLFSKKDVIVIEEEEEDNKSLVSKLHEITKSSQMLSFNTDFASPPKKQLNQSLDVAAPRVISSTSALSRETSTSSNLRQRTPLGRQYAGAKRNSAGAVVFSEVEKGKDQNQSVISTNSVQQDKQLGEQKKRTPEAVDLTDSQDDPKSPVMDSSDKTRDGQTSHVSPAGSLLENKEESRETAVDDVIVSIANKVTLNNESSLQIIEKTPAVQPVRENLAEKQLPSSSNVLPPDEHSEDSKSAEKEVENQDNTVSERLVATNLLIYLLYIV